VSESADSGRASIESGVQDLEAHTHTHTHTHTHARTHKRERARARERERERVCVCVCVCVCVMVTEKYSDSIRNIQTEADRDTPGYSHYIETHATLQEAHTHADNHSGGTATTHTPHTTLVRHLDVLEICSCGTLRKLCSSAMISVSILRRRQLLLSTTMSEGGTKPPRERRVTESQKVKFHYDAALCSTGVALHCVSGNDPCNLATSRRRLSRLVVTVTRCSPFTPSPDSSDVDIESNQPEGVSHRHRHAQVCPCSVHLPTATATVARPLPCRAPVLRSSLQAASWNTALTIVPYTAILHTVPTAQLMVECLCTQS
jgi:hypothetical protein